MESTKKPMDKSESITISKSWFIETNKGKSVKDMYAFKKGSGVFLLLIFKLFFIKVLGTGTYGEVLKA